MWAPYWMRPGDVRASGFVVRAVRTPAEHDRPWRRAIDRYRSQFAQLQPGWLAIMLVALLARHPVRLVAERSAHA